MNLNLDELIQRFRGVRVSVVVANTAAALAVITGEVVDGPGTLQGLLTLKLTAAYDGLPVGATINVNPQLIIAIG